MYEAQLKQIYGAVSYKGQFMDVFSVSNHPLSEYIFVYVPMDRAKLSYYHAYLRLKNKKDTVYTFTEKTSKDNEFSPILQFLNSMDEISILNIQKTCCNHELREILHESRYLNDKISDIQLTLTRAFEDQKSLSERIDKIKQFIKVIETQIAEL